MKSSPCALVLAATERDVKAFQVLLDRDITLVRAREQAQLWAEKNGVGLQALVMTFSEWDGRDSLADALGVPRLSFAEVCAGETPILDLWPATVVKIGRGLRLPYDRFLSYVRHDFSHGGVAQGRCEMRA